MPVDYHAWTHRPKAQGGTDPIESGGASYFRALHYNDAVGDDITITSSQIDVTWNYWENGNTAVFDPRTSGAAVPTLGTHLVQNVRLLLDGLYIISWGFHLTANFVGTVAQYIHDGDTGFGRADVTMHGASTVAGVDVTRGHYVQTLARVYPPLDPLAGGAFTPTLSFDASQNSGSNKTLNEGFLEIVYFPTS